MVPLKQRDPSIQIVQQKLKQDSTLHNRTNMSIPHIIQLMEFCLKNTYFLFQVKYYEWVHGAAMGSAISPLIALLFMEGLRSKPLPLAHTPHLWLRFVNDIYVVQKAEHSQLLLQHINTQEPHIQFTMEEPNNTDGTLPFLDSQVTPGSNNTLITTFYRKPTHIDQHLHWDSNHFIGAKNNVYKIWVHRAKVVSHNQQALQEELQHIREVLKACQFPSWALNRLQQKFEQQQHNNTDPSFRDTQLTTTKNNGTNNTTNKRNISIVVPYIHGLGERLKRHAKSREYKCIFKGMNTVKTLIMASKDKDHKLQKSGIINKFI